MLSFKNVCFVNTVYHEGMCGYIMGYPYIILGYHHGGDCSYSGESRLTVMPDVDLSLTSFDLI